MHLVQLAGLRTFLENLFLVAVTVRNFSFSVLFLTRRPAQVRSNQIKEWVAAITGTFITFLYNSNASYSLFSRDNHSIIYIFLTLVIILTIIAMLSLGRSFGIVPANRGIKTTGSYAVVRHPIYSCYIIFDLLFLSLRLSSYNAMIFTIFLAATYLRANYEEGLLSRDPSIRSTPNGPLTCFSRRALIPSGAQTSRGGPRCPP